MPKNGDSRRWHAIRNGDSNGDDKWHAIRNSFVHQVRGRFGSTKSTTGQFGSDDNGSGHKAVAMMSSGNMQSSVDLVGLVEEKITLAGATIIELGPGEGFATQALVKQTPALLTVIELSPLFRAMLRRNEILAPLSMYPRPNLIL